MKTHSYQRHEKRKSASDSKKAAEREARRQPSTPPESQAGNGAQDQDYQAESDNQGDNEDTEDGADETQEGEG